MQINKIIIYFNFLLFSLMISINSFATGIVVAEKSCNLKIQGGEFQLEDVIVIFREVGGVKTRIAYAKINQKTPSNNYIGKVIKIKDTSQCPSLKDLQVELYSTESFENSESSVKVRPKYGVFENKLEMKFSFGSTSIGRGGISIDNSESGNFQLSTFSLDVEAFPLKFSGDNAIQNILGTNLNFNYGGTYPAAPLMDVNGVQIGTVNTTLKEISAGLFARVKYFNNICATELKGSWYLLMLNHSPTITTEPTITNTKESPPLSPFYNLSAGSVGLGGVQRFAFFKNYRLSLGALYFPTISGSGSLSFYDGTSRKDKINFASGYHLSTSLFGEIRPFALEIGLYYEKITGKFVDVYDKVTPANFAAQRIYGGLGVAF